jgi:hypothetical protein
MFGHDSADRLDSSNFFICGFGWLRTFPKQQYDALLNAGDNLSEQIAMMETHAEKTGGAGAALPPGFRAHLGMLQLSAGNTDQARQLWQAEKAYFPESAAYMDQLLKRLESKTVKSENPA